MSTVISGDNAIGWETHNLHLRRSENVSSHGMSSTQVSQTYSISQECIKERYQNQCRLHQYEVSIYEEEHGCTRRLVPPEQADFVVGSDKVLEED